MTVVTAPVYELWDTETGNLIADYTDEDAALRAVRAGVSDEGPASWAAIELVRVESGGRRAPIAQGVDLVGLALAPLNRDLDALQAARVFIVTLGDPDFRRAMIELRVELARVFSEAAVNLDRVRAAAIELSKVAGVPVRVYSEGPRLTLITPDKTMAELLAIGASNGPVIRAVSNGYAVDIAA